MTSPWPGAFAVTLLIFSPFIAAYLFWGTRKAKGVRGMNWLLTKDFKS
jgi:hypothetical protein